MLDLGLSGRWLKAAVLSLLLAFTVSAYALVLRDGRRVAIPDDFTVTATALTYTPAPGLNILVALSDIDVAATERANGEAAGSLLRRANTTPQTVTRTITNADLAPYRQAREERERAANRRRAALGLPSLEEEARHAEAERQKREAEERAQPPAARPDTRDEEAYWRGRAARLREEWAALTAQVRYVRARLAETQDNAPYFRQGAVIVGVQSFGVAPNLPLAQVRPGLPYNWGPGFNNLNPGTQVNPAVDLRYNAQVFQQSLGTRRRFRGGFGYIVNNGASSAEYERLRAQLDELEAQRAALNARWAALEEEARRVGVPPGWLRP